MKRVTFARLAVLMLAVAGLVLQGCGGDDNGSGISQDMYDALNAEKTASDAAAAAAMAAQAEAEADAAAAMAAQMEAEAAAAAAMAAQMEAEADAAAAMAAQATAEMNATAAIAAQAVAEAAAAQAQADLTEAEADLEAAEMALAAANEAKTMAETAKAIAESRIADAEMAQADAEAAQMEAEDAAEMYKAAAAAAETAKMAAEAERDKYKMMYEEATDVPSVGTQVGAEGRANSWRIANSVRDAVTEDSETKEMTTARIKKGVSAADLMRDDDGVSFTVKEGTLERMKTADDMADDMAPELDDWMGFALAKTSGGTTQNALVYTNIETSVTPFSSRYPYNVNDDGTDTLAAHTHYRVLGIDATATDSDIPITAPTAALIKDLDDRISIKDGLSSSLTTRSFGTDATGANTVVTIPGSYNDVAGQYRCVGTCVLTWTADGTTIHADGAAENDGLLFKADDISTLLPDPDYQTFGVWMIAQDGPVTGNSGLIRPIAMANASMFDQEDLAEAGIRGKATYKGEATGYYATRNAGSFEAESGRFTATATLEANFDAATGTVPDDPTADLAAAGGGGTLDPKPLEMDRDPAAATATTGVMYYRPVVAGAGVSFAGSKIDKFMDEDGNMMEGWVVNLNGGVLRRPADVMVADTLATNNPATVGDDTTVLGQMTNAYIAALEAVREAGTFEGTTSGTSGAMEWSGVWDASLHGNTKTALPTGIVGTFQAVAGDEVPDLVDGAINQSTDGGFAGVIGSFGTSR